MRLRFGVLCHYTTTEGLRQHAPGFQPQATDSWLNAWVPCERSLERPVIAVGQKRLKALVEAGPPWPVPEEAGR